MQEDLQLLREQVSSLKLAGHGSQIDLRSLDDALLRTEKGIKVCITLFMVIDLVWNTICVILKYIKLSVYYVPAPF